MNLWTKISDLGLAKNADSAKQRRARLTNRMILVSFCLGLSYIPMFISQSSIWPLVFVCVLSTCIFLLFFVSKKGNHQLAAVILSILLITHVITVSFMIQGGTARLFLIQMSILGFAMIRETKIGVAIFLFAFSGFFLAEYAHDIVDPIILRTQENNNALYILNITLIFIGGFYLIFHLKLTNRDYEKDIISQKSKIEKQHSQLEESHKEIRDSIQYAQRIQAAILPTRHKVAEQLSDFFILYKPKDVVAGDFYWVENNENSVYIAAADCTGHGVPGAMVSVVCNNALNRSFREHGLIEPGEILDKTREIVIDEFSSHQEQHFGASVDDKGLDENIPANLDFPEVKDGMDISLCSISGNELKYAGAYNPLWIIRNGELIEFKADKQPIGKFDHTDPYKTSSFTLEKKDSIYMFSDGYADQFGGEKGKKFKTKKFIELLISIQDKTMDEQGQILDDAFEEWKGTLEQIDDVCVIGVRI